MHTPTITPAGAVDHLQWNDQYTQQARDHVRGLRDDPDTDPKHLEGAEAVLRIVDPDSSTGPTEAPPEVEEAGYVIEKEYQYPPFIADDEVIEDGHN